MREPGQNFSSGLTQANLGAPDFERVKKQHDAYRSCLQALDVNVELLPALPDFPDAYFVEDVAVVTPTVAVISRPGAASRLGEQNFIEAALAQHLPIAKIEAPGTLDGGDVLQIDDHFYIGLSARTNSQGAQQLSQILSPYGYTCHTVKVRGSLHLKSDISYVGRQTVLAAPNIAPLHHFARYNIIPVPEKEAYAANSLLINGRVLAPKGFPMTSAKLIAAGFEIIELETSELQKMDGGLSCISLRF
jgi:dimethylargininase